jgi:SAM-dependent methyltransferase
VTGNPGNHRRFQVSPQSNAARVGEVYDQAATPEAPANMHLGYWTDDDDPADLATATEQLTAQLIERLAPRDGQRVLDVGCGVGGPAISLARAAGVEVVGVTVSNAQVEQATARARSAGLGERVRFEYADAMDLPFADGSFDSAWFVESLIHMPDKERALAEVARVLKPGSRLAVADMFRRPGHDWPTEGSRLVTAIGLDDYPKLFEAAGFTVLDLSDVSDRAEYPPPVQAQLREMIRPQREAAARGLGESLVNWLFRDEDGAGARGGFPGYVLITGERS